MIIKDINGHDVEFELFDNSMVQSVKSCVGGTLRSGAILMENHEVVFCIHKDSIWIEVPNVIGFSIDKDIAIALLKKISES